MQRLYYTTAVVALVIVSLLGVFVLTGYPTMGSTIMGNDYQATTSISTSANTHWQAKVAANGGCSLGSVVVASSSSGTRFKLWNATSTTDTASTTIADFDEAIAVGTYTYDITCTRGLVVETPTGFSGVYTVTFR